VVNIYDKTVVFHSPSLPAMTISNSTTARFFKTDYVSDRGFAIGISFSGSLQKHNLGGTNSEISLPAAFSRGALLTNV
jgi:outer membrane protein assembly factor BamA